jgi:transposase
MAATRRGFAASIRAGHNPLAAPLRTAHLTTVMAPMINSRRMSRCPIFDVRPSLGFPTVVRCRGTRPSQAAKSRRRLKVGARASTRRRSDFDTNRRALAREHLDLSEIVASYKSGLGQPPFDPRMMTALLLYAYCSGLYSSRRMAKACAERVDFMMIVAHDAPDFRTIADFRKRHLPPLGRLFLQVLKLAEKAGLAKLGHVALDGTKIKANASKHKAMSYERMKTRETELRAEVDR